MASKRFYIATFGCRTNQADSAAMRQDFLSAGYEETIHWSSADVIVVNSCTVTHCSDRQVRQFARRLRRENVRAKIVITGCYAQRDAASLAQLTAVDVVVGNTHKAKLVQIVTQSSQAEIQSPGYAEIAAVHKSDFPKAYELDPIPADPICGRTRPFVKIQDGCDAKCSYCIIPAVRGPSRSVLPHLVVRQVSSLVDQGFKEIVLTGIHIGTYGLHLYPRYPLDRLIQDIVALPGLKRLRISSIEPMELSRRVIDLVDRSGKVAPHFHICLQSGSDRVLKMMRRPYTTGRYQRIVEEIADRIPDAGIGADVIVGFPGETDGDHLQTVEFVRRLPLSYLHVFPYSDRSGTRASAMPDKVTTLACKRRSKELRDISKEKNDAFRRRFLGQKVSVLTLTEEKGGMRTALSGNYLRAKVHPFIPGNEIVEGRAVGEDGDHLILDLTEAGARLGQ